MWGWEYELPADQVEEDVERSRHGQPICYGHAYEYVPLVALYLIRLLFSRESSTDMQSINSPFTMWHHAMPV